MMSKVLLKENLAKKWLKNLLIFLTPLGVVYLGSVAMLLQQAGHAISLNDFVPNNATLGALALYVINGLLDYARKLKG